MYVYSPLSDIYSASWGPDDDGRTVDGPGPLTRRALGQDGGNVKLRRYADMTKDDIKKLKCRTCPKTTKNVANLKYCKLFYSGKTFN